MPNEVLTLDDIAQPTAPQQNAGGTLGLSDVADIQPEQAWGAFDNSTRKDPNSSWFSSLLNTPKDMYKTVSSAFADIADFAQKSAETSFAQPGFGNKVAGAVTGGVTAPLLNVLAHPLKTAGGIFSAALPEVTELFGYEDPGQKMIRESNQPGKPIDWDMLVDGIMAGPVTGTIALAGAPDVIEKPLNAGENYLKPEIIKAREARAAKVKQDFQDTVGKVLQGDKTDIAAGTEVLSNIDTSGVKTYSELAQRADEHIKALSKEVDNSLLTQTDNAPIHMDKMQITVDIGGKNVSHNYVNDAIGQLKSFYKKTNDVKKLELMKQLEEKANSEGLTPKEINDLARAHGSELNAYNANGELASGLTKQAAENTRKGVKQTAMNSYEPLKAADSEITKAIKVRDLAEETAKKVNDLKQKVQERGLGEKAGRALFQAIDLLSGGSVSSFLRAGLVPRGGGLKILNALDLEAQLSKNLSIIDKMSKTDLSKGPEVVAKEWKDLQSSNQPDVSVNKPQTSKKTQNAAINPQTPARKRNSSSMK